MTGIEEMRFDERGLVAAVAQDARTGALLMLAYMNREAVEKTLETGVAHFWSRSRQTLWRKGETSGNELRIDEVRIDCDGDAVLLLVRPLGPACHTGSASCFFRRFDGSVAFNPAESEAPFERLAVLGELGEVIGARREESPDRSYTARLLDSGIERIAKKVGEEAFETCLAAATQADDRLAEESADLLYHLLVLLEARGLSIDVACRVLRSRRNSAANA